MRDVKICLFDFASGIYSSIFNTYFELIDCRIESLLHVSFVDVMYMRCLDFLNRNYPGIALSDCYCLINDVLCDIMD